MTQPVRTLKWSTCCLLIILSGCQWFGGPEEVILPDQPALIVGGYGYDVDDKRWRNVTFVVLSCKYGNFQGIRITVLISGNFPSY